MADTKYILVTSNLPTSTVLAACIIASVEPLGVGESSTEGRPEAIAADAWALWDAVMAEGKRREAEANEQARNPEPAPAGEPLHG